MTHSPKTSMTRRQSLQTIATLTGAAMLSGKATQAHAAPAKITSEDHWAKKGNISLYLYRKYIHDKNKAPKPVLFFVHGSTFSGRGGFDLHLPGNDKDTYSLMDRFAQAGFDVWTMDHEGYGRSSRSDSSSGILSGVEDLKAAFQIVEKVTGQKSAMIYGQSSGAIRAGAFANVAPERVERLILDAFTYTGEHAPTILKRRKRAAEYRANPHRKISRATFRRIFTRDKPGTSDPLVADALANFELKYGTSVPSGTYLDMGTKLPLVDPTKITCPVLMVRAEHDGNSTLNELLEFFEKLPHADKHFTMIEGLAHVATLGLNRHRLWHVLEQFLTLPPKA